MLIAALLGCAGYCHAWSDGLGTNIVGLYSGPDLIAMPPAADYGTNWWASPYSTGGEGTYQAIDNATGDKWFPIPADRRPAGANMTNDVPKAWIKVRLAKPYVLSLFTIRGADNWGTTQYRCLAQWQLQGSNDDVDWRIIYRSDRWQENGPWWAGSGTWENNLSDTTTEFIAGKDFAPPAGYQYFRLEVFSVVGWDGSIGEWQLAGTVAKDSEGILVEVR